MRKTAVILAMIGLITGAAAVVGHNGSDGEVSITSGESASSTTEVTENGTEYTARVSMTGQTQNETGNRVRNATYSESGVTFQGAIKAPTPCHVIDQDVKETGENRYSLHIKTKKDSLENRSQACTQVVTNINYSAEFEASPGFQLEVKHDGQTMETLEEPQEQKKSLIQRILAFFGL
ncbi:MAG: hypothetical protein ACLFTA_01040 [Candidatus Nanohaloarchaea archaeon]